MTAEMIPEDDCTVYGVAGGDAQIAGPGMMGAAPDLLSCLIDILERFESCIGGGNGELDGDKPAIKAAKTAIAKALGGTHLKTGA